MAAEKIEIFAETTPFQLPLFCKLNKEKICINVES